MPSDSTATIGVEAVVGVGWRGPLVAETAAARFEATPQRDFLRSVAANRRFR